MSDNRTIREEILKIKPYIPGKPIEEVKRELGLDEVIKLASNENPLGPSPLAVQSMGEAIKGVNIYPDGRVHKLREKLSSKLGVKANQLIFGNGSDEILIMLAQTFIDKGDEVVMAQTTFSEYEFAANIMGGEIVKVPLDNYTHDLKAMAEAVTDKTKVIFICNPNNPTGTFVEREEVEYFLEEVSKDVIVVFDEAYYEYVSDKSYPNTLDYLSKYKNIIVLRTFSKVYGLGGLRVGYGIANSQLIDYVERVRQPFNVNSIAQQGALASLDDQSHVEKTLDYNSQGKKYLYQEFDKLSLEYVQTEANFILVDLPKSNDEVFKELLEKGIIIRSLSSFGYKTKIRVTIGLPEENRRFIEALRALLNK